MTLLNLGLAAAVAALATCVDAATTVAVIEIGSGGVARRTTTSSSKTSIQAVSSFWNSMHDVDNGEKKRRAKSLQYPGMTVVPDLFKRADGGVAIGITGSGVDLTAMPSVSSLLGENSVGSFRLSGSQGSALMEKAGRVNDIVDSSVLGSSIEKKAKAAASGNKLGSVSVSVDNKESAIAVDKDVSKTLSSLQQYASETGSTVVVHLVVEEEDDFPRRRLEDQEDEDQDEEEGDDDGNGDNDGNQNSNEKTIFQIQYFNVVLWTSVALVVLLMFTIGLTIAMPLEPDTLLFGESAKMVGE
eukprot:CAMPEP_0113566436 /NCGR_PEP_ID=MMETSP0015_2-20120614/22722_1 /TAXON_ID=2838 /ORGANISM="Odontella" /LENGTH=299 /DNA_ID=CAMNT_0000468725 /DNA_START=85 /DNA_END=984 /DNA_ORIENTATION=+ /assembly_acc=CAM_ASM_000160